jgi:cellulose synthase/poly-beta-1,6-N-acetylglucosamine synthase-like glycosyltransferase
MNFENSWWRAANVLEYYKWFQSRLKFQARIGVMPLGGNTVFFRRSFIEEIGGWDESCLTEDCKIGIQASAMGEKIDVVYIESMVTREETPSTLRAFVRQRVRWMQGFIQVFGERQWLRLPTFTQRAMAVYILGFQFFQAFTAVAAPVIIVFAFTQKAPIVLALLTTVPLGISVLNILIDIIMLRQFGRSFDSRVRLRDYAGLVYGAYFFQVVLAVAAVRACARHVSGRTNWVKTEHAGRHLTLVTDPGDSPDPDAPAVIEIDQPTLRQPALQQPFRAPDDEAVRLDGLFSGSEHTR